MKRLLFLLAFATLLSAGPAWAVCAAGCTTCVSLSASRTDVNTCVTNAATGATITVPSGTQSWASPVTLPSTKDLTIIGATVITPSGTPGSATYSLSATNNTSLTCNAGCFTLNQAATHRISGFTMTSNNAASIQWPTTGEQDITKHFVVDNNNLIMSPADWEYLRPCSYSNGVHPQGLFYQNIFAGGAAVTVYGQMAYWDEVGATNSGFTGQNILWAQATRMGDGNAIYIEDNYFTGGQTNYFDHNHGSRAVARFNRYVANSSVAWIFEIHGVQYDNRGGQRTEVYHNAVTGSNSGFSELRGGTGLYFNNTSTVDTLQPTIDRSEYDEGAGTFEHMKECGVGGADGNSPAGVDQKTTGRNGWRCRDQVGIWYDATQWGGSPTTSPTSFNAWNQVTRPVYIWNNTFGGSALTINVSTDGDIRSSNKITANNEFFCDAGHASCSNGVRTGTKAAIPATCTTGQAYWATTEGYWNSRTPGTAAGALYVCTATNVWTPDFVPYPYPHPWRSGLAAPTGLTVK